MQVTAEHSDLIDLVTRCKMGNRNAQMQLYNRFYKMVFNSAFRLVSNKMDAEDLMHETFITCFEKLDSINDYRRIGGWLKTTAINKSINFLNKNKNKWLTITSEDTISETKEDDLIFDEIKFQIINKEINNLPDGYRVILTLYLIEGYDHAEIGEILEIKSSTSRSQYTRARQKLKNTLLEKYERQFEK